MYRIFINIKIIFLNINVLVYLYVCIISVYYILYKQMR